MSRRRHARQRRPRPEPAEASPAGSSQRTSHLTPLDLWRGRTVASTAEAALAVIDDALALQEAGCALIVVEAVPSEVTALLVERLLIPVIGIGAGADADGQVLVWTDFAGLRDGRYPRFAKKFADVRSVLLDAARTYRDEVASGEFPAPEHSFES